jgi:hypothetical protein
MDSQQPNIPKEATIQLDVKLSKNPAESNMERGERNKTRKEMKAVLLEFRVKYLLTGDYDLPSEREMMDLRQHFSRLANTVKSASKPGRLRGEQLLILDKRYAGLGLKKFFDELLQKLISACPRIEDRIKSALRSNWKITPDQKASLELVLRLIEPNHFQANQTMPTLSKKGWDVLIESIMPYTTDNFKAIVEGLAIELQSPQITKALGWASCQDLMLQRYARPDEVRIRPTLGFLSTMYLDEYDQKLRGVFDLSKLVPAKELTERLKRRDALKRQRKRRAKLK